MAELKAKIGLETSAFETGLARLENSASAFGSRVAGMFAGAFSFGAIISQFTQAFAKASQLQDMSDRFGISAEAIQRIGNAASESGASLEDVGRALARIGVSAQEAAGGNKQLEDAFTAIGVTGQDLVRLSPEQLFYRLTNAMNDGSLAGKDMAVAKELLGRGFATLMPVLKMTEEQIRAVGEAAGIMSDDAVAKLDQFGDSWGRLSNTVKVRAAEIMDASIRLGEEMMANPMNFFGDWQQIEKNIEERSRRDREAREALRQIKQDGEASTAANRAAKDFQNERDRADVAEARQELRVIDAGIAGAAAAEKILQTFESRKAPTEAAARQRQEAAAEARSPFQVLADSLQQVGGGGRFAQIGGADSVQRDQLAVLKNIEKNTGKSMAGGVTPEGVQ